MRILYFSGDYTPHDYRFLEALAARGEDVGALFLKESTPAREERPLPEGVRALAWPGGAREFTDENFPRLVEDLKLIAGDVWPDVIHAGPVQKPAYLAARAGLQPLVAVSWGSDMLVEANSSAWMQEATHFTLDHSAALVGDCEAVASAAKSFGFPEERIVTFPWGVDLDQYTPERVGNLRSQLGWEDCFVLISTRSWEPLLGVDVLAAGFAKAARRQTDLRLLILGGGSQRAKIQQTLAKAGVVERVHFAGQVAEPEMPSLYHAADLYVSGTHSDGSSVSLMQAMACGLPVLVSDIPGNREWITPGEAGWLFQDGNAGELAEGILTAARQRNNLAEIGKSARMLAERRADWTKNFPRLFEAYRIAVEQERHEQ